MAEWRVEWSIAAQGDFRDIIHFIALDSPVNARRVAARISVAALSLQQSPLRGRVPPELSDDIPLQMRELVIPPWRLLYTIKDDVVKITGLVDGRRDVLAWLNRMQSRWERTQDER